MQNIAEDINPAVVEWADVGLRYGIEQTQAYDEPKGRGDRVFQIVTLLHKMCAKVRNRSKAIRQINALNKLNIVALWDYIFALSRRTQSTRMT